MRDTHHLTHGTALMGIAIKSERNQACADCVNLSALSDLIAPPILYALTVTCNG
jgi:hypothetical protein